MRVLSLFAILCLSLALCADELPKTFQDVTPMISVLTPTNQSWLPGQSQVESFQSLGAKAIDFQYSNETHWLKFDLTQLPQLPNDFLLYFDSGLSGKMTLFLLNENQKYTEVQVSGSEVPWQKRFLPNEYPLFQLTQQQAQEAPFYIRFQGVHHFNARAFLSSAQDFSKMQSSEHLVLAVYFGVLIALFFYNLFLGLASGQVIYFWYILATSSVALAAICLRGTLDRIFPLATISLSNYQLMFSAFAYAASVQLARMLMNTDLDRDWRDRVLVGMLLTSMILFLTYPLVAPYFGAYLGYIIDVLIFFGVAFLLMNAIQKALRGHVFAKFYLVSWSFVCLGAMAYLAGQFNFIPKTILSHYGILIGNALEMLLISFALAYRINLLTQAKDDAEKRAQAKDKYQRLVRTLAHDVTNSLSIILVVATQIQNAKILRASNNIQKLLHRIRNSESFQDGKEEWKLEEVNLKDTIFESEFIFSEQCENKKIRLLHEEIPTDLKVMSEPITLLNEVLNNAISNAIKFSNENSIIELKCLLDKPGHVILEIIDKGIGIPKSMLDKFFLTSEMKSRIGTKGEKGTGYGIPLMVQYMRAYGGSVRIRSEEGKGSRVILQFKRAAA